MAFWKPGSSQPPPSKTAQIAKSSANKVSSSSSNVKSDVQPVLSKSVMGMKFMKRKEEAIKSENEERLKYDKINSSEHWVSDNTKQEHAMEIEFDIDAPLEVSIESGDLYSALPGRRSFGGFNKAVEKHYQQMIDHKRFEKAVRPDSIAAIDDEEMLLRYENLVGLPRGPSQGVRQEIKSSNKSTFVRSSADKPVRGDSSSNKTFQKKVGYNGIEMEEITHFEDRRGESRSSDTSSTHNKGQNKRKDKQSDHDNSGQKKKKFKR